ncbi:MAG: N-acetyl sugar amidotransferase [Vicinamibacterales bacterium]
MNYCTRCVLPDTRPALVLDAEGVCNACRVAERRASIDWDERHAQFRAVLEHAKAHSIGYDCIIPVSGGKDSTWQVLTCLEHGLTPLAVTWKTPARTAIGEQNLQNLIRLGVDHIDYSINPETERVFMLEALRRLGSPAIPMHLGIFSIPLTLAARYRIPLVVWGENSAFEYGTRDETLTGFRMDAAWLRQYGVSGGTTAADWVSDRLSRRALAAYFAPSDQDLQAAGVSAIFLGYYFDWDVRTTYEKALAHGFRAGDGPRTGYYEYADIDDDFISIHHHLKWYKFGFTRAFDNLSLEIRRGRMTREQAIAIIRARGDDTPHDDIAQFCRFVGLSEHEFFSIAEQFRNRAIWSRVGGRWCMKEFLIPDWKWT